MFLSFFTVTRWNKSDEESLDLIEECVLVRGVRRIYRNWKDLYQVASALGVLIDVDEESLKAEIRNQLGSRLH